MTQDEIQELEREANGLYQAGDYHRAREVWKRILESDPENPRAAEGIRMASLLSENWNFFAQEGGEEEVSLRSGLDRVLRMTQGGDFEGAFGLIQKLEKEFPESESLGSARQEVQNAYEMAPFLNEQLRVAQEKLEAGELDEARAACAKVLALDSTNRSARMMQEQIEYGGAETAPPVSDEPLPAADLAPPDEGGNLPELELVELEEVDDTGQTDEMDDLDEGEAASTAFALEAEAPPEAALEAQAPASLSSSPPLPSDEIDAGLSAALGLEPSEAPPAPPSQEWSLESHESLGALTPDQAPADRPPEAPPEDLAVPTGLDEADSERFLALVEEGHRALDERLYQDAIELLSHALAMDENHEGAMRLLDRARREQAESHRVAEAKMLEAMDLYDSGRLDQAGPLFAQVLDAIPNHHSAQEYMERIEVERASALSAEPVPEGAPMELEEPLDLPELGAGEPGAAAEDMAGISPGEVALDQGSAEAVDLLAPPAGLAAEEAEELPGGEPLESAEAGAGALEDFPELEEGPARAEGRSRRPLLAVVALLLVGAGVAGWFYRDRIVALFEEGGDKEILSQEQRASLGPPAAGETRTEAQILEMIEEATNGSAAAGAAQTQPERVGPDAAGGQPAQPTRADVGRLLEQARTDVRAGRGAEALTTLKTVLNLDEQNSEVGGIQRSARLIVTARDGFSGGEYEESLRALYRLDAQVAPSLRPVAVGRWLDNTRWNYLLAQLQDEQPWQVLDLTHASRGALQLRGADREAVRPLIEVARRWQYESGRELKGSAYHSEVDALRFRSFDE